MPPSLRGYFHTDRNLFKKKWKEDTDIESKRQEKPYRQGRGLEISVKPELGIEPGTSDPRHHRTTPTPPHLLESQVDKKTCLLVINLGSRVN